MKPKSGLYAPVSGTLSWSVDGVVKKKEFCGVDELMVLAMSVADAAFDANMKQFLVVKP